MRKRRVLAMVMAAAMSVSSIPQSALAVYADDSYVDELLPAEEDLLPVSSDDEALYDLPPGEEMVETEWEDGGLFVDPDAEAIEEAPGIPDYAQEFSTEDEDLLNQTLVLSGEEIPEETLASDDEPLLSAAGVDEEEGEEPLPVETEPEETEPEETEPEETETEVVYQVGLMDKKRGSWGTILSAEDLKSASVLEEDQKAWVEITKDSDPHYVLFSFTAPEADTWRFYSMLNDQDPYAELYTYDSTMDAYLFNEYGDDEEGSNFSLQAELEENETCYIRASGYGFKSGRFAVKAVSQTKELEAFQILPEGALDVTEGDHQIQIPAESGTVCLRLTVDSEVENHVISVRAADGRIVQGRILNQAGVLQEGFTSKNGNFNGVRYSAQQDEIRYICLEYLDAEAPGSIDIYIGAQKGVSSIDSVTGLPQELPKGLYVPLPELTVTLTYEEGAGSAAQSIVISDDTTVCDKYLNRFWSSRHSEYDEETDEEQQTEIRVCAESDILDNSKEQSFPVTLISPSAYMKNYLPLQTIALSQQIEGSGQDGMQYILFDAPEDGTYSFELSREDGSERRLILYDGTTGIFLDSSYVSGADAQNLAAHTMKAGESIVLGVESDSDYSVSAQKGTAPVSLTLDLPEAVPSDVPCRNVAVRVAYAPELGLEESQVKFDGSYGGTQTRKDIYGNAIRLTISEFDDESSIVPGDYTISARCEDLTDSGTLHVISRLAYYADELDTVEFPAELSFGSGEYRKRVLFTVEETGSYYLTGLSSRSFSLSVYDDTDNLLTETGSSFADRKYTLQSEGILLQAETRYLLECYAGNKSSTVSIGLEKAPVVTGLEMDGTDPRSFPYWSYVDTLYPLIVTFKDEPEERVENWLDGAVVKGNPIICSLTGPDGQEYASYAEFSDYYEDSEEIPYGIYNFHLVCGDISGSFSLKYVSYSEYRLDSAIPVGAGETELSKTGEDWGEYVFTAPESGYYQFSCDGDGGMYLVDPENGSGSGLTQYRQMEEGDRALLQCNWYGSDSVVTLRIEKKDTFRIPEGENSVQIMDPPSELFFYADSDACGYLFTCDDGGYVSEDRRETFDSESVGNGMLLEEGNVYRVDLYSAFEVHAPLTVTRIPLPEKLELALDQAEYVQLTGNISENSLRISYEVEQEDGSVVQYRYPENRDSMPYRVSWNSIRSYEDGETWWNSDDSLTKTGRHTCVVTVGGRRYEIPFEVVPFTETVPSMELGELITIPGNTTLVRQVELDEAVYSACSTKASITLISTEDTENSYSHYIDSPIRITKAGSYYVSFRNTNPDPVTASVYPVETLHTEDNSLPHPAGNGRVWSFVTPDAEKTLRYRFVLNNYRYYMYLYQDWDYMNPVLGYSSGDVYELQPDTEYTVFVDRNYTEEEEEDPEDLILTIQDISDIPVVQSLTIGADHDTPIQTGNITELLDSLEVTVEWDQAIDEEGTTQTVLNGIRDQVFNEYSLTWEWRSTENDANYGQQDWLDEDGIYELTVSCGGQSDSILVQYENAEPDTEPGTEPDTEPGTEPNTEDEPETEPRDDGIHPVSIEVDAPSTNPSDDYLRGVEVTLHYAAEENESETLTFKKQDGEYLATDSYGNVVRLSGDTWVEDSNLSGRLGSRYFTATCTWTDAAENVVFGSSADFGIEILPRVSFLSDPESTELREGTQVSVTVQPGETKYVLLDCRIGGWYMADTSQGGEAEEPSSEILSVELFDADTEEQQETWFRAVRGRRYLLVLTNENEAEICQYAATYHNEEPETLRVQLASDSGVWTGMEHVPGITVHDEFEKEVPSDSYTLSKTGALIEPGVYQLTVAATGELEGMTGSAWYYINPVDLGTNEHVTYTVEQGAPFTYTGQAQMPAMQLSYMDMQPEEGTDYTTSVRRAGTGSYTTAVNVGDYYLHIKGGGSHYTGNLTYPFRIEPAALSDAQAEEIPARIRDEEGVYRPVPVFSFNGQTLTAGTDFAVTSYQDDDKVGEATVTVEGRGNFTGTVQIAYTILDERIPAEEMTALQPTEINRNTILSASEDATGQWAVIDAYQGRRILLTFDDGILGEIGFYRLDEDGIFWVPFEPGVLRETGSSKVYLLEGDASQIAVWIPAGTDLMAEVSVPVTFGQTFTVEDTSSFTTPQIYELYAEKDWQYEIDAQTALTAGEYGFSGRRISTYTGEQIRMDLLCGTHYLALNTQQTGTQTEVTVSLREAPEQLANLSAAAGVKQISLAWGIGRKLDTEYRIYRKAGDGAFTLLKSISNRSTTSFTDTDVTDGVQYTYYMTGVYGAYAEGPASEEVFAEPIADTEQPVVRTITPENGTRIHGTASISATATDNYRMGSVAVYARTAASEEAEWMLVKEQDGDRCTAQLDTTQYPDGEIQVKAVATDLSGNTSEEMVTRFIVDNTGPSAVTNIEETHTSVTITLSWPDVPEDDRARFLVEELQEDESWKQVASVNTLGVNRTGLVPESTHTYRIISVDDLGNRGGVSEPVTVTTDADTTAPVITEVNPKNVFLRNDFDFTGKAVDEYAVAKIRLEYATDYSKSSGVEAASWTELDTFEYEDPEIAKSFRSTVHIADLPDGTLTLRAIAWDYAGNESDTSDDMPLTQVMIDRTAPNPPSGLAAQLRGGYVHLTWSRGEQDVTGYRIFRALSETAEPELLAGPVSTIGYVDKHVAFATTYYYCVSAVDAAGNIGEACDLVSIPVPQDEEAPVVHSIRPESGSVLGGSSKVSVLISDNNALDTFYSRYSTDQGETWTDLPEQSVAGHDSDTCTLDLAVSDLDAETLLVEVWCTDVIGTQSEHKQAQYGIDTIAPSVSELQAAQEEGIVTLTWNCTPAEDLYGFEIWRRVSGSDTFRCIERFTDDGEYFYEDGYASEGNEWEYYVAAVDTHGNRGESDPVTVSIPAGSRPDVTAPRAYISCGTVAEAGAEYVYSASGSYDDRGIVSWVWDFGDETGTKSGAEQIHTFEAAGEYKVTLTVSDEAGNTGTAEVKVTVREPASVGTVAVTVVDEKDVRVQDAGVYFNLGQSDMTIRQTDGNGQVILTAGPGVYPIGAYKDGYLPAKTSVTVLGNGTQEVKMVIEHKNIVVGDLKVHRMTLDEILEAGINVADPANQHLFKFTIELTYCDHDITLEGTCDEDGNVKDGEKEEHWNGRRIKIKILNIWGGGPGGGGPGGGGGGGGGGWPTMKEEPQPVVVVVDIPGEATWLKDFFDAELTVMNQADEEFWLDNCRAEIHTDPGTGLTLMDSKYTTSNPVVDMGSIQGGSSGSAHWILRGDEPGSYQISADFSAILRDFGANVSATFEASEPVEVRGGDQLWLDIVTESRILKYTDGAIKVGFRNESDYPVYYPNLALEYVTPVRSYKMKGMKQVDTSRDILETGEELWYEYIIPREKWEGLIENEDSDMYLIKQILTQMSGLQMQYQFDIVQPMSICADKIEVYEYDNNTGTIGEPVDLISLSKTWLNRAEMPYLYLKTYKLNEDGELEPAPMTVRVFDGYQTLLAKNEYYAQMKEKEEEEGYFFDIDDYPEFKEPFTVIETGANGVGIYKGYTMKDFSSQDYEEGEDHIQEWLDSLWGNVKTQAELDKEEYEQENKNAKSNYRAFDLMFTASRAQTTIPVVVRGATAQEGTVKLTVEGVHADGSSDLLKGARVQIGEKENKTGKDGTVVMTVPAGPQKVVVKKGGYLTCRKTLNVGERTEDVIYLDESPDTKHSYVSNISTQFNTSTVIIPENTLTGKITVDLEGEAADGEKIGGYAYKIVDKDGSIKEEENNIPSRSYLDLSSLKEGDRLYFGVQPVEKDTEEPLPVQWRDAHFTIVAKPSYLGDKTVDVSKMDSDGTFTVDSDACLNISLGSDLFTLDLKNKSKYDDNLSQFLEDQFRSWKIKTSPAHVPATIKLNPRGRIILAVDAYESNSTVEEIIGWFSEDLANTYGALKSIKLDINLDYDLAKTRWMMSVFGTADVAAGKAKLAEAELYHLAYADASINYSGRLQLGSKTVDFEEGEMLLPVSGHAGSGKIWLDATGNIYLVGGSLEAALKAAAGVELLSKWLLAKGLFLKLGFEFGAKNADLLGLGARYLDVIIKAGTEDSVLGQELEHIKVDERYELLKPTDRYVKNKLFGASADELLAAASVEPDFGKLEAFMDDLTLEAAGEESNGTYSPVKEAENHSWTGGEEILEEGAYYGADPQIVSLPDGSVLMVYTDFQSPYDPNNPLAVFYAVLKNGTWSQPKQVRNDGTLGMYPSLQATENGAHLTWLNVAEPVTGMEAENTLDAIVEKLYQNLTVCEAWYDVSDDSWTWTAQTPEGSSCYMESPVSAVSDSRIMTVWVENRANSADATEAAPDTVWYRLTEDGTVKDSGQIQIPLTEYDVTKLTIGADGSDFRLTIQTLDETYSQHLYLTEFDTSWQALQAVDEKADEAVFVDGALYYLGNNAIYRKAGGRTKQAVASDLLENVKEFSAASYGEGGVILAWSVDTDPNAVCAVISEDGIHYTEPVIAAVGDGTFGKPKIAQREDDIQIVYKVYTETAGEDGSTADNYTLRTAVLESGINVAIASVQNDAYLSPGFETNTTVCLANRGTRNAEDLTVKIASNPEASEGTVLAEQEIGNAETAVISWRVPLDYDGEEYYVIVSDGSGTETRLDDNVAAVGGAYRDAGIYDAFYVGEEDGKTRVSLTMQNEGAVMSGPLQIRVTDITQIDDPKVIAEESYEALAGGDCRDVTMAIERPENSTTLYLEVLSELGDVSTANNTQIVTVLNPVTITQAQIPTTGTIGADNEVFWSVSEDGTLTLSLNEGVQAAVIPDYAAVDEAADTDVTAPWADLEDQITKITVGEGITRIGDNAFDGLEQVTGITVGEDVEAIGSNAFGKITGTQEEPLQVTLPESLSEVAADAFDSHLGSEAQITFEGTQEQWASLTEGTGLAQAQVHVHTWSQPQYKWAEDNSTVKAERICTLDEKHKETETADTTSAVTRQPTCTQKGETTFTAVFKNEAFETQTKTVEGEIDPDLHDWSAPEYVWAEDNSSVTATRVCTRNANHKETETASAVSEVTKPATCTEPGTRTYMAVFEKEVFKTQTKEVPIAALGHDYGTPTYTWAKDHSSVTATRVCTRNKGHKETETVSAASKVTKEPTYVVQGVRTYTAVFTNPVFKAQTTTAAIPVKNANGTAQTNLTWSVKGGVLTVSAKNSKQKALIPDYSAAEDAPWAAAAAQFAAAGQPVTEVVVAEGVTQVGKNSFSVLSAVKKISLPKSLEKISPTAFNPAAARSAAISYAGNDQQWKSLTKGSALAGNKSVKAVHEHSWSAWTTVSAATLFRPEQQKRTCSGCGEIQTRTNGKKLRAVIQLSAVSGQIAAGKKVRITANILPGNVKNYPLKWTSSNRGAASVNATGLVKINKKAGGKRVVITATSVTDPSEKATFTIKIMKGAVKKITVKGKKKVKAGKSVKLKAKVKTTKGKANKKVKWISSNTAWATVAANGKVTALPAGKGKTVKITAMATDGSGKKKVFKIKIK